jgi:hypothetical protein
VAENLPTQDWKVNDVTIGAAAHLQNEGVIFFRAETWLVLMVLNIHEGMIRVIKILTLGNNLTRTIYNNNPDQQIMAAEHIIFNARTELTNALDNLKYVIEYQVPEVEEVDKAEHP